MTKNQSKVDAVFVPALCTSWDEMRLSKMCEQSVITAGKFAKENNAKLILSNSNLKLGDLERRYKVNLLKKKKFKLSDAIYILPKENVTNTYDEVERLSKLNKKTKFKKIAVVGEQWHMPRIIYALNKMMPNVEFIPVPFESKNYEALNTKPSLKGIFASTKLSWIIYNVFSYLLAPLLVTKN